MGALIAWATPSGEMDWRAWLSLRDPFYDMPIGIIFAVLGIAVSITTALFGASMGVKYFASPPEPDGDVAFRIESDGSRTDVLPPRPWTQRLLGLCLWLAGPALILFSTHMDEASMLLFVLTLSAGTALHFMQQNVQSLVSGRPSNLRTLMTPGAYQEQTTRCTAAHLAQLQDYIRAHPFVVGNVRDGESELRLRRFADGAAHVHGPREMALDAGRKMCA